jgi:predicted 3-demethylubiquinone-9 3-methyltransferase (glyoxalase superfamily)
MKTALPFFLALSFIAFAGEEYDVYDLQGGRVPTFEAKSHGSLQDKFGINWMFTVLK